MSIGTLFVLMLFALAGTGLIVVLARLRQRGHVRESCCARCRYPIAGRSHWECPECGGDLRVVGILTPRMRLGPGPLIWMTTWSIICLVVGLYASHLIRRANLTNYHNSLTTTFQGPASGEYADVVVSVTGTGPMPGFNMDDVVLRLMFNDGRVSSPLYIDLNTMRMSLPTTGETARPRQASVSMQQQDLLTWMGMVGIDTTRDDIRAEAADLYKQILVFQSGGSTIGTTTFAATTTSQASRAIRNPWYGPAMATSWLIVWIVPVGMIIRRY